MPACADSSTTADDPLAIYYAESGGMANKPVVLIGVAIGAWEADTTKAQRSCIVFACSKPEGAPRQMTPTIPYLLGFPEFPMLATVIEPENAADHPDYQRLVEVCGEIIANDARFMHLRDDPAARRARFAADAPASETG